MHRRFRVRRVFRSRKAQGLVELALVLPLIVLLLVGTIDMARWLDASHRLGRVANEGARYGAVKDADGTAYPTADEIRSHILAVLPDSLKFSNVAVNTSAAVGTDPAVSVRVTAWLPCFTPGFGTGIMLSSESWFPRR